MALFLDGPAVNVDSLTQYDSNVLTVAATEGINLTTKILLSQEAMHLEIERMLRRGEFRDVPGTLIWASTRMRRGIGNVVWSKAMRVWQVYESLALIYRDAYYSQLNDRHQARSKEYTLLANTARRDLVESGLGIVYAPLRRPEQPIASLVPASEAGGTYYFSVTFTGDDGQEGSASALLSVDVTDGNAADLKLTPPLSANATGWNLYAGTVPDQLFRQNDGPLVLTSDWAYLPSLANTSGLQPGLGQAPEHHWPLHQYLQRG